MDLQYYGGNAISLSHKGSRIVIDDTLAELGVKSITKPDDVALFTGSHGDVTARLTFDRPGEYEVSEVSIVGIPARAHMDEDEKAKSVTMFKLIVGDANILVTGHIHPDLSDAQLESIGVVDVLVLPIGGNGYTLDPVGALKVIRDIEPKIVVPTHYADSALNYPVPQQELSNALKELSMEPKETVSKLKIKLAEMSDATQLVILEKS